MQKANEAESLKRKVDILNTELKTMEAEFKQNIKTLEQNLKYTREANQTLKADYDVSQEKFDKHMKVTNNQMQDLKEKETEYLNKI